MGIQAVLVQFNDEIKMSNSKLKELREKRNVLIDKLKENDFPDFKSFDQGSYAMHLGVIPESEEEYDIDVGLRFDVDTAYITPFNMKQKICKALENHTDYGAVIKDPCVTVTYKKDGEAAFHVDLVPYVYDNSDDEKKKLCIAKGKKEEEEVWEAADPKGLIDHIKYVIADEKEREQFRRIVRYIKKWRNQRFSDTGHIRPPSIGITLMVLENFAYRENDDLQALIDVLSLMLSRFEYVGYNNESLYRVIQNLPSNLNFPQNLDIFAKMTDKQMTLFKKKLEKFKQDLLSVVTEIDEYTKYVLLTKIWNNEVKIPDSIHSYKKQSKSIVGTSVSG